jgi:hypothetical protein
MIVDMLFSQEVGLGLPIPDQDTINTHQVTTVQVTRNTQSSDKPQYFS